MQRALNQPDNLDSTTLKNFEDFMFSTLLWKNVLTKDSAGACEIHLQCSRSVFRLAGR